MKEKKDSLKYFLIDSITMGMSFNKVTSISFCTVNNVYFNLYFKVNSDHACFPPDLLLLSSFHKLRNLIHLST